MSLKMYSNLKPAFFKCRNVETPAARKYSRQNTQQKLWRNLLPAVDLAEEETSGRNYTLPISNMSIILNASIVILSHHYYYYCTS